MRAVVGARLKGFRVGERVALHHHVPCLDCHACRHRSFAQCAQYKRTGITTGFEPAGGGYAEYVRVMRFVLPGVVRIPARNSFLEGAMLEPVNTVLKAVNRLSLLPQDFVLLIGQGPIGLMFTCLLALRGMNVAASDLLPARLKLAKKFGAQLALRADGKGFRASAMALTRGQGFDGAVVTVSTRCGCAAGPGIGAWRRAGVAFCPHPTGRPLIVGFIRGMPGRKGFDRQLFVRFYLAKRGGGIGLRPTI